MDEAGNVFGHECRRAGADATPLDEPCGAVDAVKRTAAAALDRHPQARVVEVGLCPELGCRCGKLIQVCRVTRRPGLNLPRPVHSGQSAGITSPLQAVDQLRKDHLTLAPHSEVGPQLDQSGIGKDAVTGASEA